MNKVFQLFQWVQWVIQAGMYEQGRTCPAASSNGDEGPKAFLCSGDAGHVGAHRNFNGSHEWPNIAPGDRGRAIGRVVYLMPALTDDALHAVLLVAEAAPKRPLDRATLDEHQRARENGGEAEDGNGVSDVTAITHELRPGAYDRAERCPEPIVEHLQVESDRMVAEEHDREVVALRSQVEALIAQVERFRSSDARKAVDAAAERLGLVYLELGGKGNKARAALFDALGVLFGERATHESAIVTGAWRAVQERRSLNLPALHVVEDRTEEQKKADGDLARPVPGEIVDVEHSGERGPRRGMCPACERLVTVPARASEHEMGCELANGGAS